MSLQKMPKIKQTMKKIQLQILNWTQNKLEGDHMPKIYASKLLSNDIPGYKMNVPPFKHYFLLVM